MTEFTTWRSLVDGEEISAIPDSAVYYWPFRERDNNTVVELAQNDDATSSGTTNISNDWFDGYAESGDGTDNEINIGKLPEFWPDELNDGEFSIRFTIETTTTDSGCPIGTTGENDQLLLPRLNIDGTGTSEDGNLEFIIRDDNSDEFRIGFDSPPGVNDGNKHRIVLAVDNLQNGDARFAFDGDEKDTTIGDDDGPSNFVDLVSDAAIFNDGVGGDRTLDANIDIPILDNKALSSQEIQDDYDEQPWS